METVHNPIEHSHTLNICYPYIFLSQMQEHKSRSLNPNFQPFLVYISEIKKRTFERTPVGKKAFFTSQTGTVFDLLLHIDHLEFFKVIALFHC